MRKLLAAMVLVLAAGCADPGNDNVSVDGPSTTAKDRTTTTGEATTTTARVTTTTAAPVPVEVGRWSGDADTDTANITVKESWELHWIVSGGAGASVSWYEPGAAFPSDYLTLSDGQGSSLIREGGTFYLEISTFGATYEVWAVDVPN